MKPSPSCAPASALTAEAPASGGFLRRAVLDLLARLPLGRLELELPDGERRTLGEPQAPHPAHLRIRSEAFFRRVVLHGDIGLGESYMEGEWETDDLTHLLAYFLRNLDALPLITGSRSRTWALNSLRFLDRITHRLRRNTRENARQNIASHYDLSNAFYGLWLDRTWTYSSAYFEHPGQSLAEAQEAKYRRLCRHLGLKPGMQVLEIGCGWGGFAELAVREFGVRLTGLTLSTEQLAKARERAETGEYADRAQFLLQDYRDHTGNYDAIVSIEMIEAVGHEFLDTYFRACHRLLKPQGVLALQAIVLPDGRYEASRRTVDFIQKHIFPGGQCPSIRALMESVGRVGDLSLQQVESFGTHYAKTLRLWREAFFDRIEAVRQLGFDERFIRKWHYYLAYCEAAFAERNVGVAHLIWTRPNNVGYPGG